MIIQHNLPAMNAHRQLLGNNNTVSKALEKLSSGYRINRAGDDAAGLAISEKMRAQIRGLNQAERNTQDAISLIQTAEGALNESHAILQRMRELSVQAANGVYDDEVDRANLDKEVARLKEELNRISTSTNFNGIELLDGTLRRVAATIETEGADTSLIENIGNSEYGTDTTQQEYSIDLATVNFEFGARATTGADLADPYTITIKDADGGDVVFTANDLPDGAAIESVEDIAALFNGVTNAASTIAPLGAEVDQYEIEVVGTKLFIKDIVTETVPMVAADADTAIDADRTGVTAATAEVGGAPVPGTLFDLGEAVVIDAAPAITQGTAGFINTGSDLSGKLKVVQEGKGETVSTTSLTTAAFDALGLGNGDILTIETRNLNDAGDEIITKHQYRYVESGAEPLSADNTATPDPILATFTSIEDLIVAVNASHEAAAAPNVSSVNALGSDETGIVIRNNATGLNGELIIEVESVAKSAQTQIVFEDNIKAGTKITVGSQTFEFVADADDVTFGNSPLVVNGLAGGEYLTKEQAARALNDHLNSISIIGCTNSIGVNPGEDDHIVTIESLASNEGAEVPEVEVNGGGLVFQIGANGNSDQRVTLNIEDCSAKNLGVDQVTLQTADDANRAIVALDGAINSVSSTRADLGALQNRMEHTSANLKVAEENLQAAESRIRDVDMAEEMMNFTKANILVQSAQAMLAQANLQPQGILQLLQQ